MNLIWQRRIGRTQTAIVVIMLIQVVFTGVMRLFPPEMRRDIAFLHRIEWGVYAMIVLIAAQVALGLSGGQLVTNRVCLLGLRLGKERILSGKAAHLVQLAFTLIVIGLVIAALWVRARGFLVQPPGA